MQFATLTPRLFANSRTWTHLFLIVWQSLSSVAQSFHSSFSASFHLVLSKTCAWSEKHESNWPFSEQFFSRGFFPGSFDMNSDLNSRHFLGKLRGLAVGGTLRVLGLGRFDFSLGWLQWSLEQHLGRQVLSTNKSGLSLQSWSLISLHGLRELHLYFGAHCLEKINWEDHQC